MSAIAVRALQPNDFGAWHRLWLGYQVFYRVAIPEPVTKVTFDRLLDPAEPMECGVAEDGAALVGIVHVIRHRSCWTAADTCYLQDLFVEVPMRRRGIGRLLIGHAYALAAAQGCPEVYWLTHETNAAGMALYDRVAAKTGFLQYERRLG